MLAGDLMDKTASQGAILDQMFTIIKNNAGAGKNDREKTGLLRNCFVTMGRVAQMNQAQAKDLISKGGIEVLTQ